MATHQEIVQTIETFAPLALQESYDNAGWQVGNPQETCSGILINLDLTDQVLDEAIALGYNLIICHHPLIFSGLKKLTGSNYVERLVIKAIQNNISVYAAHTNLDNVKQGVNHKIAMKLGLDSQTLSVLSPIKGRILKLQVFVPLDYLTVVQQALFEAGAGEIGNYYECSFSGKGQGTFRPNEQAQPFSGISGGPREIADEVKLEVLVPDYLQHEVFKALRNTHPYEEIAHDWILLQNAHQDIGAGMFGFLPQKMSKKDFLALVKKEMQAEMIRFTDFGKDEVHKIAVCGGSGSFLIQNAKALGCDVFLTADFKYHQFFDAENQIMIVDIGHYESEQFTSEIFYDLIKDKFTNFAVQISKISTNPVKYYY